MSKHEIEIEGLPEGWEPIGYRFPKKGDCIIKSGPAEVLIEGPIDYYLSEKRIIVRRKVRKYDWSKTLDDVFVTKNQLGHCMKKDAISLLSQFTVSSAWQPNIHGVCPVDPGASIVRARFSNGSEREDLARVLWWDLRGSPLTVIAYQFVRLAEGYEW